MGSHRFPLPWSPRSDSLDRCTSHEDRWSDFLRQRAKGGKRGFVLSVGGLPLWRAKLRAVAPHLSSDHSVKCLAPLPMPRLILKARRHDIRKRAAFRDSFPADSGRYRWPSCYRGTNRRLAMMEP
jgi:hypothetical protein